MTTAATRPKSAPETALRRQFERDRVWSRMVGPGARVPVLPLVEVDLGPIHLDRLLRTGPLVLVFFPHADDPLSDAALVAYQRTLLPSCTELSAHLIAVSPQRPDLLAAVKHRHDLDYLVAADPRHSLIDAFAIGYRSPHATETLGTGRAVLPYPTVVVADRTGTVGYVDVRPDGVPLTEAGPIIAALARLAPAPAHLR
jgi:peroxiredoxin